MTRWVVNLAAPRTASVYIDETLLNVRPHGHYHLVGSDWRFANMRPLPAEYRDDFRVGVVRNPFDLIVSHYALLRRMDVLMHYYDRDLAHLPFRDYLTLVANRRGKYPQRYPLFFQYFDAEWNLGVDYLARYETLDADLREIARLTGGRYRPKKPRNQSARRPWPEYYDPAMIEQVRDAWYADLHFFGYDHDGWDPDRALCRFGYQHDGEAPE